MDFRDRPWLTQLPAKVPRQHVADSRDPVVCDTDHGEPLQCEGGPGAIPQDMFQTLKIVRHVAVHERDADA